MNAADLSDVQSVAIDETSCQRGYDYLTLVADAVKRHVIFVTEGKNARTVESFAKFLPRMVAMPAKFDRPASICRLLSTKCAGSSKRPIRP